MSYTEQEIRERMSISTLIFRHYRPLDEKALSQLPEYGITTIELLESTDQFDFSSKASMRHVFETCRAVGVKIGAYHAHYTNFSGLETETKRIEQVDFCKRQIDTMLESGGKVWGCHAQVADDTMTLCFEELLKYVEGKPVVLAIENFVGRGMWVRDRIEFLEKFNHPQLGMILDIGHVRNDAGENPMTIPGGPSEILDLCGPRLCHIHIHGFVEGVDHFPPFAEGDGIQWRELFQKLKEYNYPGYFNFEPKGAAYHSSTLELTAAAPSRIANLLHAAMV
jgi:sugar phosphate isomerase/epimerase